MAIIFISGIGTGVGKTVATGVLARIIQTSGYSVITQKPVQTGCPDFSEDLEAHRALMGIPLQDYDQQRTTCTYLFSYPASPHLAARLEGLEIDPRLIDRDTKILNQNFNFVLQEGAGGLMIPLKGTYTLLDYLEERRYPVILVSSSALGSINHTLLSLEALKHRKIPVAGLIYNCFFDTPPEIQKDSLAVFQSFYPELKTAILNPDATPENLQDWKKLCGI